MDRPSPSLWRTASARQLFLVSPTTELLSTGPGAMITNLIPDLHYFRGSYGGKHVFPLMRDASGALNITSGLLAALEAELGHAITGEDLLGYCYALLQAPSYTRRFENELEIPGPRIPLTRDVVLFERAVEVGRELVWLHTYGERFVPPGHRAGLVPQGVARYVTPIPAGEYPESHSCDEERQELHVGDGVFEPVSADVRAFSVSGLE